MPSTEWRNMVYRIFVTWVTKLEVSDYFETMFDTFSVGL